MTKKATLNIYEKKIAKLNAATLKQVEWIKDMTPKQLTQEIYRQHLYRELATMKCELTLRQLGRCQRQEKP